MNPRESRRKKGNEKRNEAEREEEWEFVKVCGEGKQGGKW